MTDAIYSTNERTLAATGAVSFLAGCLAVALFNPSNSGFFPGCPLLETTGFACPGCGLTRGFHALFHGDFIGALDFNLLVPLFAIGFVYLVVLLVSIAVRGRHLPFTVFTPGALWFFTISAVVFGVVRNIPVYPFEVLFP